MRQMVRRAPCGCRFLRLSILGWIQQHLWFSPSIFLHSVACPAASHLVLGAKTGVEVFNSPSSIWTRRAVLSRRGATPAETWKLAQTDHATLDLVAAHMHSSGLEVQDFVPQHMKRLYRRLALGMDGISLDYLLGNAQWDEPTFFVEAMRGPSSDAGRFLRTLLGALEAEVEFIPPICLACRQPCYSECPRCTAHWCDECRGDLEFCPMCGSSDEELSGDDADGAGSV